MSETIGPSAPGRRCHGHCGLPIPADETNTYQVIGPDGTLREVCDGDCLGTHYLRASREGEAQARLATVVRTLEEGARSRRLDVVLTSLAGASWTCEISNSTRPRGRVLEGTAETIEAAISTALVPTMRAGAPPGSAPE
jgi:hypothetical protein